MAYRLAIVEDEAIVAHSIEQKLSRLGYEVGGVFYRGEDLLSFLETNDVDLILMDIHLQENMSGIEVARQVFERFHIPVVYLTAYSDDTTLQDAAKTDPYGYLIKPFNDRELKATVEMALYKARAVRELAYREARWRSMFLHIRDGMVLTDIMGKILSLNPAMMRILDLDEEVCKGKSLDDIVYFIPQGGKYDNYELLEVKGSGKKVFVYHDSSVISDEYGRSFGTIHIFGDISDRIEYEKQLSLSELRYRSLVDGQVDWVVRMDASGGIEYANDAMALSLGWEKHQLVGENFFDVLGLSEEEKREWLVELDSMSEESTMSRLVEYRRQGVRYHIEWRFRCVSTTAGKRAGKEIQGIGRDITLLKETEEALREEEEFLRRVLMTIEEGVVILDHHGAVSFVNARGREILGMGRDSLGNLFDFVEVFSQQEKVEDFSLFVQQVMTTPAIVWRFVNRWGRNYDILVNASQLKRGEKSEPQFVLLLTDLTLFNKLQEEFYRAQRLEAMEVLAGGIAHDFNNILTIILGNLFMLRSRLGEKPDLVMYIREAEEAGERAKQLTKQMLSFARGGVPLIKQGNILQVIEDTVRFLFQGSGILWRIENQAEVTSIPMDVGQISQVIQNLVLNAREAMMDHGELVVRLHCVEGKDIHARVPEPLPNVERYFLIEIADTGPGIDPSLLPRIFDPYVSSKSRGSGLGLAIVYTIVRKHHGLVEVDSTVGKGTVFRVYLPLYAVGGKGEPLSRSFSPPPRGELQRVWILDDEVSIVRVLEKSLRENNYDVVSFSRVEDFFRRLDEVSEKDLVVMDMTMPGEMPVEQRLERLYAAVPRAKVLLMTGYAVSEEKVLSSYPVAYLHKPFALSELLSTVYHLLQEKKEGLEQH